MNEKKPERKIRKSSKTEPKNRKKRIRKVSLSKLTRISFLPSIFTLFNLFLGFLALINIVKQNYILAAYLIATCVVMDGFDGTIARLTKTESNFGMQLDSLVDAVSFGLASAAMIYFWGFNTVDHRFGLVVSFIFLSAGVIRLARFNVYKEADAFPSNIFIGLPIPGAALAILSVVLVFEKYAKTKPAYFHIFFGAYSLVIAYLMVSNVKYRTIKKINPKYNLIALFIIAAILASVLLFTEEALPALTVTYLISPIIGRIISKFRKKKPKQTEDLDLE